MQFDERQLNSHKPGEIDPANISISGGLFYQNNFQLDGFNMNNDLDPISGASNVAGSGGNSQGLRNDYARSQGFNIHTSLLDSIVVLDSNIGAAYGGFTGGVVEANVRNPRLDGWHFDINYQHTSDKLTHYYIDDEYLEDFEGSTTHRFQPKFTKHLIKASLEGWVNEKFGIIGAFSTTRSYIPLQAYTDANSYFGTGANAKVRNQTRRSDNFYLKMIYNLSSDFSLEANLGYMPQFNTYFNATTKDSFYTMQSGGYQAGLKALWDTKFGLWTNSLGYSFMESSRKSDKNYYLTWRHSADDKNWAATSSGYAMEGGVSDVDQIQHTLSYKSDYEFKPLDFLKIRVGAEFDYQYVARDLKRDYWYANLFRTDLADLNGASCAGGIDLFGVPLCSTATTTQTSWNGQYIKHINKIEKGLTKLDTFSYSFYAEEDLRVFDYDNIGELNARFGLRFDGDSYMDKDTVAPRFSLAYALPWDKSAFGTRLSFGANRYYGRNLFSYRLWDSIISATKEFSRAGIDQAWTESSKAAGSSSYKFDKLEVPYSDEVMVGLSQDMSFLNLNAKYIKREGRDEIMQRQRRTSDGLPALDGYSNTYYYFTNEGKSSSDIISISVENSTPLSSFGINHHFLLAFDRTLTQRTYNEFAADNTYIDDPDIFYNGQIIKYSERPTENFVRPWTLRLNTTQTMKVGWVRLLWNNFFRYRSGYDRMVRLLASSPGYNTTIGNTMTQYGKYHFKGVFNWDMRVGLEFKMANAGTLYTNVDIINVLNSKNMTTFGGNAGNMAVGTFLPSSAVVPVYDIGRQVWLQFGYKY